MRKCGRQKPFGIAIRGEIAFQRKDWCSVTHQVNMKVRYSVHYPTFLQSAFDVLLVKLQNGRMSEEQI